MLGARKQLYLPDLRFALDDIDRLSSTLDIKCMVNFWVRLEERLQCHWFQT